MGSSRLYANCLLAAVGGEVTWVGRGVRGPKLFWASLPWVIASAWAIHIILDSTLESWRGTIRDRASSDRDRST